MKKMTFIIQPFSLLFHCVDRLRLVSGETISRPLYNNVMSKRERFPGWNFIKNTWGQLLDRPCVQNILREVQTPAMLRVKLLTTLLNDEFVDKEGDLYDSRKKLEELQCELKQMKAEFAEMAER